MEEIKLSVWVGDSKRVILDLPANIPVGLAEIVVIPQSAPKSIYNPKYPASWIAKREEFRKKMLVAGILSTSYLAPAGIINELPPSELLRIGTLPLGVRSTDELIDEDRGPR